MDEQPDRSVVDGRMNEGRWIPDDGTEPVTEPAAASRWRALWSRWQTPILGQTALKDRLGALGEPLNGRFFLFQGPTGQGKSWVAHVFAGALLAHFSALDEHQSRVLWQEGTHPDYRVIESPEPGRQIPVQDLRDQVVSDSGLRAQMGRLKVYRIDGDALSEAGQNILLKTLEEPPPDCLFLMEVTQAGQLLDTVRSRAVLLKLLPNTDAEMRDILGRSGVAASDMQMLLRYAEGCPGQAIQLAQTDDFLEMQAATIAFMEALPQRSPAEVLLAGEALFKAHAHLKAELLHTIELWCRDRLVGTAYHLPQRCTLPQSATGNGAGRAGGQTISAARMGAALNAVQQMRDAERYNGNAEIVTTHVLLQLQKELSYA